MNSSIKRPLFWPSVFILGLSFIAGAVAVLMQFQVARGLLLYVLQPGAGGVALIAEEPLTAILFPLRLFAWAFLAVTVCAWTAWVLEGTSGKFTMFLLLIGASLLLMALTLWAYRGYMQGRVEDKVDGRVLAKTRGQLTSIGAVPIFKLGLLGPVVVCAGAAALGRRQVWRRRRAG